MWNKRKLTKKSLNELAEIMPVLNEQERKSCIGGTQFYNLSGTFLGSVGPGNDIRIISPEELYTAKYNSEQNNDYTYKSSNTWGSYIQQSDISSDSVVNIVNHATGVDKSVIRITSGVIQEAETWKVGSGSSGFFLIQIDRASLSLKNTGSLNSTMRHESIHVVQSSDNQWQDESDAYMHQTSDPAFKSLPSDYRQMVASMWTSQARQYYDEFHSGVIPSGTIEAIRDRCGV